MKNRIVVGIATIVAIVVSSIVCWYFLLYSPHDRAVKSFNQAIINVKKKNKILENNINSSKNLLKREALNNNIKKELTEEIKFAEKSERKIPKIKKKTTEIREQVKFLNKNLDYSKIITNLNKKKSSYQKSVKQLKQITNPTNTFIEERLNEIDTITGIQSVTENNDPNKGLNKQGSYTASVYFTDSQVLDVIEGVDIVDKGTDAGGDVEVFKTVEDAKKRDQYLSNFDSIPAMYNPGSHHRYGTVVIRISARLTATQQEKLTHTIYEKLIEIKDKKATSNTNKIEKSSSNSSGSSTSQESESLTTQNPTETETSESSSELVENGRGGVTVPDDSVSAWEEFHSNIDENGYNKLTGENVFDTIRENSSSSQDSGDYNYSTPSSQDNEN